jgi:hypothetical protein
MEILSKSRAKELNEYVEELGNWDHTGRPFRKTASAMDMKAFNIVLARRVDEELKMLEKNYH